MEQGEVTPGVRVDRETLAAELQAQRPRLRTIAARYLGSADAVDEVLQDVAVRAIERLDSLRNPASLGAWLAALTRNAAIDHLRRARRESAAELHVLDAASPPAGEFADRVVNHDLVHTALAELGERDRQALVLRDGYDVTVEELARRLQLTSGSTRVMLVRARKRFAAVARAAAAAIAAALLPRLRRAANDSQGGTVAAGSAAAAVAVAAALPVATAQAASRLAAQEWSDPTVAVAASTPARVLRLEVVRDEDGGLQLGDARAVGNHPGASLPSTPDVAPILAELVELPEDAPRVAPPPDLTIWVGDQNGDHVRLEVDLPVDLEDTPAGALPIDEIVALIPDEIGLDSSDGLDLQVR